MTIETAITAATASTSTATSSMSTLSDDYNSFLQLLTAQVANQDPLEPMDSSTFVSQLAQLSSVEQQIITNSHLETIGGQVATAAVLNDLSFVGHEVTIATDQMELIDSEGSFFYELADTADTVSAQIYASDGTLVKEFTGLDTTAGTLTQVTWDGTDSDGLPVPDDTFTVQIVAEDAEGESVTAETYATTAVEGITYAAGLSQLLLRSGETNTSANILAME
ncbi:flagellar hook assembly protein FlgD [Pseudooceanicola nanhaiensis]|uniref:flagellar hook assembly protein FlgD n=1 Tax=Pseudooceanicola nanhaiensis TaxID=375761 RepID=UPI001CD2FAC5|nr:flagellar hook assembly protein FlgD [Pseudooceanicola nanhaiensis]MCA0922613.1 flagellar hook assembly protein FlgD [Pseudooceanicola nanhaiensis]